MTQPGHDAASSEHGHQQPAPQAQEHQAQGHQAPALEQQPGASPGDLTAEEQARTSLKTPAQHTVAASAAGFRTAPGLEQEPGRPERVRLSAKLNPGSVLEILPQRLADLAASIAKPLGVHAAMAALTLLSVTSAVAGVCCRVAPHADSTERLLMALWSIVCAPPGTGTLQLSLVFIALPQL